MKTTQKFLPANKYYLMVIALPTYLNIYDSRIVIKRQVLDVYLMNKHSKRDYLLACQVAHCHVSFNATSEIKDPSKKTLPWFIITIHHDQVFLSVIHLIKHKFYFTKIPKIKWACSHLVQPLIFAKLHINRVPLNLCIFPAMKINVCLFLIICRLVSSHILIVSCLIKCSKMSKF